MLLLLLLLATPYEDTKSRFRLELAEGWRWAPQPGDTQGTWFKKTDTGAIGNFGVRVLRLDRKTTLESIQREAEALLSDEPGYRKLAETKLLIAGRDAMRREYTVFVAGNARTQKRVEDTFLIHGDTVFWLHFETLAEAFDLFRADVKQMLDGFVPLTGGQHPPALLAKLVGRWQKLSDSLIMELRPDGTYTLGEASGTFSVERTTFLLRVPNQGEERFQYVLKGDELVVSGAALDRPIRYRRLDQKAAAHLPGRWIARKKELGVLKLSAGGQYSFGERSGNYQVRGDLLVLRRAEGGEVLYTFLLDGDVLKLWGGDLSGETLLDRR